MIGGVRHASPAVLRRASVVFGLLGAVVASAPAKALTATGSFSLQFVVASLCTVSTTTLDFGNVPNINGPKNATSTITVTCTNGVNYAVGLGPGLWGGSVTTRQLRRVLGTETINYGIYRNPPRTQNWGQTVGVDTVAGTGNGAAQALTVRGQIPNGQGVKPNGGYADTVQVIVTY